MNHYTGIGFAGLASLAGCAAQDIRVDVRDPNAYIVTYDGDAPKRVEAPVLEIPPGRDFTLTLEGKFELPWPEPYNGTHEFDGDKLYVLHRATIEADILFVHLNLVHVSLIAYEPRSRQSFRGPMDLHSPLYRSATESPRFPQNYRNPQNNPRDHREKCPPPRMDHCRPPTGFRQR